MRIFAERNPAVEKMQVKLSFIFLTSYIVTNCIESLLDNYGTRLHSVPERIFQIGVVAVWTGLMMLLRMNEDVKSKTLSKASLFQLTGLAVVFGVLWGILESVISYG